MTIINAHGNPHRRLVYAWEGEVEELRAENERLRNFLRQKDEAMGVLFERLAKAGVDCSDLIS